MKDRTVKFEHGKLDVFTIYDGGKEDRFSGEVCDMTAPECDYWCAVNGECFGLGNCVNTCIANVSDALGIAYDRPYSTVYVIWTPRTLTPSTVKRWVSKWSKRTARADHYAIV